MNGDGVRFYVGRDPSMGFGLRFVILERRDGKKYAGEIVFREIPPNTGSPAGMIDDEAAQSLADSLWEAGIRPAGAAGSAGQLQATSAHLQDMRKMAQDLLAELLRRTP